MLKQSPDTDMQAFSVDHVGMLEGLDTMKTIFLEVFLFGEGGSRGEKSQNMEGEIEDG